MKVGIIMQVEIVALRLILVTVLSAIIGFEREVNNANAGLKTHMIVGVGATIVALISEQIEFETIERVIQMQDIAGAFRVDPSRLIAQVVSGIGFLGAGTIIVTKRHVSGLTTAASIWAVASLGLAVGMGFLNIALPGFAILFLILFVTRRIQAHAFAEKLHIKYVGGNDTLEDIENVFKRMGVEYSQVKYDVNMFGNEKVYTTVFNIQGKFRFSFNDFVSQLSKMNTIVSVQTTNLE